MWQSVSIAYDTSIIAPVFIWVIPAARSLDTLEFVVIVVTRISIELASILAVMNLTFIILEEFGPIVMLVEFIVSNSTVPGLVVRYLVAPPLIAVERITPMLVAMLWVARPCNFFFIIVIVLMAPFVRLITSLSDRGRRSDDRAGLTFAMFEV